MPTSKPTIATPVRVEYEEFEESGRHNLIDAAGQLLLTLEDARPEDSPLAREAEEAAR